MTMRSTTTTTLIAALLVPCFAACGDDGGGATTNELITTVILTFTPDGGGTPIVAEFDDPDGDGGLPPTVDPVNLPPGDYALAVRFQNRLETPPEEITDEVRDESDQHLILFTGSAVVGPATTNTTGPLTQAYADTDAKGLPIGLANTVTAGLGTGMLVVTLRHMPPEQPPQKGADTLALVKASGIDAIGGSTDASVTFAVTAGAPAPALQ
ncbi:MAG: hypothetical protein KF773_18325 [Deltaproteobacteria bacterium]|nr:hypothetical protein [Deltaproteobacteria bacterium]